jgi:hypothetical protein
MTNEQKLARAIIEVADAMDVRLDQDVLRIARGQKPEPAAPPRPADVKYDGEWWTASEWRDTAIGDVFWSPPFGCLIADVAGVVRAGKPRWIMVRRWPDTLLADEFVKRDFAGAKATLRDGDVVTLDGRKDCYGSWYDCGPPPHGKGTYVSLNRHHGTAEHDIMSITLPTGEVYSCRDGTLTRVRGMTAYVDGNRIVNAIPKTVQPHLAKPEPTPIIEHGGRHFQRTGEQFLPKKGEWFWYKTDAIPVCAPFDFCSEQQERLELLPEIAVGQKWKFVGGVTSSMVTISCDDGTWDCEFGDGSHGKWATAELYRNFTLLPTCPHCGDQYDPESKQVKRDGSHCPPRPDEAWLKERGYEIDGFRKALDTDTFAWDGPPDDRLPWSIQECDGCHVAEEYWDGRRVVLRKFQPATFEVGDIIECIKDHDEIAVGTVAMVCGINPDGRHEIFGWEIDGDRVVKHFRLVRKGVARG